MPHVEFSLIQKIILFAIPILFAITLHELAHGWVASRLGDSTAKMLGRITLNPLKHIDPVGTILVPALCLIFGGFMFGWAKPIPVNGRNLRHPRRDQFLVALAGPGANLLMAVFWAFLARLGMEFKLAPLLAMSMTGVYLNCLFALLNLLPLPPLDGSHMLSVLLPKRLSYHYDKLGRYGLIILILLMITNVLSFILDPAVSTVADFFFTSLSLK